MNKLYISPQWISVKERLPERVPGAEYSQVQCIVNKEYKWVRGQSAGVYYQIQILVFNHEHECWDTEDGDDYDCDINQVTHWMPLPEPPEVAVLLPPVSEKVESQEELSIDELIVELDDKRILKFSDSLTPDMWYLSRKQTAESLLDKFTITRKP